jgi:hypothetical protein
MTSQYYRIIERIPAVEARRLRLEAERCFRLACGIADAKLSDELEAIGRDFEREAELLEGDTRIAA